MRNRWILLIFCYLASGFWLFSCTRPIPTQTLGTAAPVSATPDSLAKTRTNIAGQIMATLTALKATTEFAPLAASPTPVGTVNQTIQAPTSTTVEPIVSETPLAPVVSETIAAPTASEMTPLPTAIETTAPSPVAPTATTSPIQVLPTAYPTVQQGLQPVSPMIPPTSVRPSVYILQKGEFPWCLARRFDIDPRQLMCVNGFCNGQVFYPGQVILIPQQAWPFPGQRALRPHPATYTVRRGDTIYKIACYFGDIDPILLAQINNIPQPYRLQVGQVLMLP
jgi:LysM repeat protein